MLKTVWALARQVPIKYYLIGLAAAIAIGYIVSLKNRLGAAEEAAIANELKASNAIARAQTAEALESGAVLKLALQQQILSDTTAELARFRQIVARTDINVTVDSGRTTGEAPVTEAEEDVRVVTIDTYNQPFRIIGAVSVPPPPIPARFDLRIGLDPIHLTAQIGCLVRDEVGFAALTLDNSRSPWARVSVDSVVTRPGVCPTVFQRTTGGDGGFFSTQTLFIPLGVGIGALTSVISDKPWWQGALIGGGASIGATLVF